MADNDLDNENEITENDVLMQDLYKQLDADRSDDEKTIEEKIKKKRKEADQMLITYANDEKKQEDIQKMMDMLKKAEAILLNKDERQKYDNALQKQTLTVGDPTQLDPAFIADQNNGHALAPGQDVSKIINEFEKFVDGKDGVIDKVGSELSAADKDNLAKGNPRFGMDASQPGMVKFTFPDENSANQFVSSLLQRNMISLRPGFGRRQEDEDKLQDKNTLAQKSEEQEQSAPSFTSKLGATPTLTPPGSK